MSFPMNMDTQLHLVMKVVSCDSISLITHLRKGEVLGFLPSSEIGSIGEIPLYFPNLAKLTHDKIVIRDLKPGYPNSQANNIDV